MKERWYFSFRPWYQPMLRRYSDRSSSILRFHRSAVVSDDTPLSLLHIVCFRPAVAARKLMTPMYLRAGGNDGPPIRNILISVVVDYSPRAFATGLIDFIIVLWRIMPQQSRGSHKLKSNNSLIPCKEKFLQTCSTALWKDLLPYSSWLWVSSLDWDYHDILPYEHCFENQWPSLSYATARVKSRQWFY